MTPFYLAMLQTCCCRPHIAQCQLDQIVCIIICTVVKSWQGKMWWNVVSLHFIMIIINIIIILSVYAISDFLKPTNIHRQIKGKCTCLGEFW